MSEEEFTIGRGQMISIPDPRFEMLAAAAMQGMMAAGWNPSIPAELELIARYSHDTAEAMLRERKRRWQSQSPSPSTENG